MSAKRTRTVARKRAVKKPAVMEFDPAEYLDSDEMIAGYLTLAMEDPNPDVFLSALSDVARAKATPPSPRRPGSGARA